jgi:hypothetical protein
MAGHKKFSTLLDKMTPERRARSDVRVKELRQEMLFHGTKGWVRVCAPFNPDTYADGQLEIRIADGSSRFERFGEVNQYKLMIEAFNRSVTDDVPFACTLEFSRGNQVMIDMVKAAAS